MADTTYYVHDEGRIEPTENAEEAEFYSRMGYRVSAHTEGDR
jgi:hypothetical protein